MILPIKAIVPLTGLCLAFRMASGGHIISIWNGHAALELLFFLFYVIHRNVLNAKSPKSDNYEYEGLDRQVLAPEENLKMNLHQFATVLEPCANEDAELRQSEVLGWFSDSGGNKPGRIEELREGNVRSWLAWAFFKNGSGEVNKEPEDAAALTRMVSMVEEWMRFKLDAGTNEEITPLRLTLDGIRSVSHPLIHYLVTHAGCVTAAYVCFKLRGFKKKTIGKVAYWVKNPKGDAPPAPAFAVISGIGIGLVAYMKLIDGLLTSYPNRRLILCDLPEYSLRFTTEVDIVSPRERAEALAVAIGEEGAHVIGHSLGSVVMSWLIRLGPKHTVKACTFIDPVCFLLFNSSVAANFCYRKPRTPLDCLVSYFVGKELYVSNALHRYFRWDLNVLTPNLLKGIPTSVVLADHDHFVPSIAVEKHLAAEAKHIRVLTLKDHSHAQFCVMPSSTRKVLEEVAVIDAELTGA